MGGSDEWVDDRANECVGGISTTKRNLSPYKALAIHKSMN